MLLQIVSSGDSTIISKLEALATSMAELHKKVTLSPWIPFFTALLGGVLVLLGQYFDRQSKKKQEKRKEVTETFAQCELLLFSLKGLVKDLAGDKNLSAFWHYSHVVEEDAVGGDEELSKKYYEKSLADAATAIERRAKISDYFAQYYSYVSKFKTLTRRDIDLTSLKNLAINAEFEEAPEIAQTLKPEEARQVFHANTLALSKQYLSLLAPLDTINEKIKSICEELN